MTVRGGRGPRALVRRIRRSPEASDATTEPAPAPPPEAVFDRSTGPCVRRASTAQPGAWRPEQT